MPLTDGYIAVSETASPPDSWKTGGAPGLGQELPYTVTGGVFEFDATAAFNERSFIRVRVGAARAGARSDGAPAAVVFNPVGTGDLLTNVPENLTLREPVVLWAGVLPDNLQALTLVWNRPVFVLDQGKFDCANTIRAISVVGRLMTVLLETPAGIDADTTVVLALKAGAVGFYLQDDNTEEQDTGPNIARDDGQQGEGAAIIASIPATSFRINREMSLNVQCVAPFEMRELRIDGKAVPYWLACWLIYQDTVPHALFTPRNWLEIDPTTFGNSIAATDGSGIPIAVADESDGVAPDADAVAYLVSQGGGPSVKFTVKWTAPGNAYAGQPARLLYPSSGNAWEVVHEEATEFSVSATFAFTAVTIGGGKQILSGPTTYLYGIAKYAGISVAADYRHLPIRATAIPTVSGGAVTAITITDVGSGYLSVPTVSISGNGSGATATATVGDGGSVEAVAITSGGSNYSLTPIVSFTAAPPGGSTAAGVARLSENGELIQIVLTSGGRGYVSTPSVTITPNPSDLTGGGAVATAIMRKDAVLTISVGSGGSGYTSASVTISSPNPLTKEASIWDDGVGWGLVMSPITEYRRIVHDDRSLVPHALVAEYYDRVWLYSETYVRLSTESANAIGAMKCYTPVGTIV